MKLLRYFKKSIADTNRLIKDNKESIQSYNEQTLPKTLLIAALVTIMPVFFSMFRDSMTKTVPAYLIAFSVMILLYLLFQLKELKKIPLLFVYALGISLFILVCYLSLVRFKDRPAATALTFFTVMPLLFIDKSRRIDLFCIVMFIIHAFLSFDIKGQVLGSMDLINCFVSLFLGLLFGRIFLISRLNTFEMKRLLILEKETDFLTGLHNRRKLYKDYKNIQEKNQSLIGFLMIDIDNFKHYNDKFGHSAGDNCLVKIGKLLLSLQEEKKIRFYRFGGEEFVGITSYMLKENLFSLAEEIRLKASKLDGPNEKITVSIGLSLCMTNCYEKIEEFINKADKALYNAKESGRNCISYIE